MASRVMHYLIAKELTKKIEFIHKDRFVAGALSPDLSSHEDGSYDRAHFWVKDAKTQTKEINWCDFEKKYSRQMEKDEFYLGYYSHLIMDSLWFYQIVNRLVRIHPFPERNLYYQKGYQDYCRLNYLLTKQYGLFYQKMTPMKEIGVDEINLRLWEHLFAGLQSDIQDCNPAKLSELEIYPLSEIMEYIRQSIELCLMELSAFQEKKDHINPERFYVSIS